ncbi:chemotaxis protein CheD [Teredinibacter turnerae]|uniref:Probable chemoreceptor glutamine deamidase CheD n=1 Tax=Teredinibacter turnerae (strain ATCC 39867 / T7901) TaxID=377629 RepID=C5BIY6_TERTT|nr:chemotaxis protein CheD [Teredinibacter turnerae]ACR14739.1 chemotaxis protein, stimulates methylation of MCP protein [Teredinibacter turnerae T7901]
MHKAVKKVVIHAGEYCFDREGTHVHTLLGSCISITLWHPKRKIGGICHFALPKNPSPTSKPNPRYADDCMKLFLSSCESRNTKIREYEVKVFGGSDVTTKYPREMENSERSPIGEKNSVAAFELLLAEGANIVSAHVGESGYRRIIFDIGTGDVWVKFRTLEKTAADLRSLSGRR